jgi:predicted DNA-binding transcriptional regulator YafY
LERLKDGKRTYYRYENRDYSINKRELTDEELNQLRTTIMTLSRYRGLPSSEWLEEVITNLECRFGLKANSRNLIDFEQNKDLKGLEHLSRVIDATINHQCLKIQYHSYRDVHKEWIIHPYYIKQYNNRWFLFGLNDEFETLSNIALDRIVSITELETSFKENQTIDFNSYFDNVIGVTIPKDNIPIDVVLRFDEQRYPYIVSKPLHRTQRIIDEMNHIISIHVCPNKELESLIFSFGPQVEVVSPIALREQIKRKIEENLKKYFPVQNGCTEG